MEIYRRRVTVSTFNPTPPRLFTAVHSVVFRGPVICLPMHLRPFLKIALFLGMTLGQELSDSLISSVQDRLAQGANQRCVPML